MEKGFAHCGYCEKYPCSIFPAEPTLEETIQKIEVEKKWSWEEEKLMEAYACKKNMDKFREKNEFLCALGTDKANTNTDLSLYSRFVGNWTFIMTTYDEKGQVEDTKEGEWLFSYVMDGYGIQDVFICPKRGSWTEDDMLYGDYGTTIRVPMMDNPKKWNIVYVSKWSVDRLIAEEVNNDIIQTGINKDVNDKTIWQWNFRNITEDSFSWESIYSKDNGQSWKYATKVEAKRA